MNFYPLPFREKVARAAGAGQVRAGGARFRCEGGLAPAVIIVHSTGGIGHIEFNEKAADDARAQVTGFFRKWLVESAH